MAIGFWKHRNAFKIFYFNSTFLKNLMTTPSVYNVCWRVSVVLTELPAGSVGVELGSVASSYLSPGGLAGLAPGNSRALGSTACGVWGTIVLLATHAMRRIPSSVLLQQQSLDGRVQIWRLGCT